MNYLDKNQCARCGGVCCRTMPGATMPQDILDMFPADNMAESLIEAFETRKWVIDCWEGDPRPNKEELDQAYYIRPKNDDSYHSGIYSFTWGGRCIFHTDTGCQLDENERPYSCRMLEPKQNDECVMHDDGGKQKCSIAWIEYTEDIILAAQVID